MGFCWGFFCFTLLLASVATHKTLQWYQSNLVCIKIDSLLRVFDFGTYVFKSFENEIFCMKKFRPSVVLYVYGHEMI